MQRLHNLSFHFNMLVKRCFRQPPEVGDVHQFVRIASQGENTEIKTYLQTFGKEILDVRNIQGYSALMAAAEFGRKETLALLLEAGANPDLRGSGECTALYLAANYGQNDCLKTLLSAGADKELPNLVDVTPLAAAMRNNHAHCMVTLLDAGADLHDMSVIDSKKDPMILETLEAWHRIQQRRTEDLKAADIAEYSQGTKERLVIKSGGLKLRQPTTR